jgi:hypothetical protein
MNEPISLFCNTSAVGDCFCSEPAFRYAVEHMFPYSDRILIVSEYPEFFLHLSDINPKVLNLSTELANVNHEFFKENKIFTTFPIEEGPVKGLIHASMHCVDYISLHLVRSMLPPSAKGFKQKYPVPEEIEIVSEKFKSVGVTLKDTLLLHPGLTWPSRTIPMEWWEEFLPLYSGNVCVIGKEVDNQYIPIPEGGMPGLQNLGEGIPSLANKLSLRESIIAISQSFGLLTNDSAPLHFAGAFNNYLFTFATAKEWYNIQPFNHNKSFNLVKKFLFPPSWSRPILESQRIDLFPEGINSLTEIMWTPKEAAEFIESKFYLKNE